MQKKFTTTIMKKWFEMKTEDLNRDGYFVEYKETTPFWQKRIEGLAPGAECVLLVGNKVHRFKLIKFQIVSRGDIPTRYREAIKGSRVYAMHMTRE